LLFQSTVGVGVVVGSSGVGYRFLLACDLILQGVNTRLVAFNFLFVVVRFVGVDDGIGNVGGFLRYLAIGGNFDKVCLSDRLDSDDLVEMINGVL